MSLKSKLLEKIKSEPRFWHKGELEDYSRELGYEADNGDRRLRELTNAGLIERRLNKKGCALYASIDSRCDNEVSPYLKGGDAGDTVTGKQFEKLTFGDKHSIHIARQNT